MYFKYVLYKPLLDNGNVIDLVLQKVIDSRDDKYIEGVSDKTKNDTKIDIFSANEELICARLKSTIITQSSPDYNLVVGILKKEK